MLDIVNLSKYYSNTDGERVLAVSDLFLQVNRNEFVCIVGSSGCGKTTTLRLVAGLDRPTKGKITLDGKKINGPSPERGVVFQEYTLFPWRTVLANITFGLEIKKIGKQEACQIAGKYLQLVGLADYSRAYPYELSGGMQQRVAIARALAADPKILLMDEPFGALDARTRELLQNELIRIWQNNQKTIIFVTHSINEAIFLADRIVVMKRNPGRIQEIVTIELPRSRERTDESYKRYYTKSTGCWKIDL